MSRRGGVLSGKCGSDGKRCVVKEGAAEAAPNFSWDAVGGLPLDELGIPPAVPLPLGDVRLDVAGPPAISAVGVEADKLEIDIMVNPFPVNNVYLSAPTRRTEADGLCHSGRRRCHLLFPPPLGTI